MSAMSTNDHRQQLDQVLSSHQVCYTE